MRQYLTPSLSPPGIASSIATERSSAQPSSRSISGEYHLDLGMEPLDPEAFAAEAMGEQSHFDMAFGDIMEEKIRRRSTTNSRLSAAQWQESLLNPEIFIGGEQDTSSLLANASVLDYGLQRPKSSCEMRSMEHVMFTATTDITVGGSNTLMVNESDRQQAHSAPGSVILSHRELQDAASDSPFASSKRKERQRKVPKVEGQSLGDGFLELSLNEQTDQQARESKNKDIDTWRRRLSNPEQGLDVPSITQSQRAKSFSDLQNFSLGGTSPRPFEEQLAPDDLAHQPSKWDLHGQEDGSANVADNTEDDGPIVSADYTEMKEELDVIASKRFHVEGPWKDDPSNMKGYPVSTKVQPPTSQAAMILFQKYSKDIETASRAATFGSRRLSTGDIDSIYRELSLVQNEQPKRPFANHSRSGVLGSLSSRLKRGSSVLSRERERRSATPSSIPGSPDSTSLHTRSKSERVADKVERAKEKAEKAKGKAKEKAASLVRQISNRRRQPRVDSIETVNELPTSPENEKEDGTMSPSTLSFRRSNRNRSKSDAGWGDKFRRARPLSQDSTLSQKLLEQGIIPGVPASPANGTPVRNSIEELERIREDAAGPSTGAGMDWSSPVQNDIVYDRPHFEREIKAQYPRLPYVLVERIATEQVKRYESLMQWKREHTRACNSSPTGQCENGSKCRGITPYQDLNNKMSASLEFQATTSPVAANNDDEDELMAHGFPLGIPIPPVALPAEFECPICFKMKRFQKPSDWTKHVHEDVQPFSCTFVTCPNSRDNKTDSRRFKRKADWVRHENERHRRLEWWACKITQCSHICYRRDNFVKHLVREHRYTDPQIKSGIVSKEEVDKVNEIVVSCHENTAQQPRSEPCVFCGEIAQSWKKHTVHLAHHMERLSLPLLEVVLGNLPTRKLSEAEERRQQGSIDSELRGGTPQRPPATNAATSSSASSVPSYMFSTSGTNEFSPLSSPVDHIPNTTPHSYRGPAITSHPGRAPLQHSVSPISGIIWNGVGGPSLEYVSTSQVLQQGPESYAPQYTENYAKDPYQVRVCEPEQQYQFTTSFDVPVNYATHSGHHMPPMPPTLPSQMEGYHEEMQHIPVTHTQTSTGWQHNAPF